MKNPVYKGRELDFYSLLQWGKSQGFHVAGYHSNGHEDAYGEYFWICGFANSQAKVFTGSPTHSTWDDFVKGHWVFGGISYEVKNQLEELESPSRDFMEFPISQWFVADIVIGYKRTGECFVLGELPEDIPDFSPQMTPSFSLEPQWSLEQYTQRAEALLSAIQRGDIYEVNLCQAFEAVQKEVDTLSVFYRLNNVAQSSFAAYFSSGGVDVMSASPERYIRKRDDQLISQPIKGTSPRFEDSERDRKSAQYLVDSEKERAENVMIVDMVRNDLSHTAQRDSVVVEELFGVYSFNTVHQMISTLSSRIKEGVPLSRIISTTFPMGSMTGAPKVSAMKHIDREESTKRGWYSGSLGYVDPSGNMDLNVIIRTLLYQGATGKVQTHVGSALTILANTKDEYNECLLKVNALRQITSQSLSSNE